MNEANYKITFANGEELTNLKKLNDSFVSETEINPSIFSLENLEKVTISDQNDIISSEKMVLVGFMQNNKRCYFSLRPEKIKPDYVDIIIDNQHECHAIILNNFKYEITEELSGINSEDLHLVTVIREDGSKILDDEKHKVYVHKIGDGKWIITLMPIPKTVLEYQKMRADIDYISMISDITLD